MSPNTIQVVEKCVLLVKKCIGDSNNFLTLSLHSSKIAFIQII